MRRKQIVFGSILIAVVLAGIVFGAGCLLTNGTQTTPGGLVLDADAHEWEPSQPIVSDEQQGIKIPGYGTIIFPAGEENVALTLYNPKENACVFQFSLYIDDEETPIYTSDAIEPGKAVQEITLNRALQTGEYVLKIQIDPYDPQSGAKHNNAVVTAKLQVI